MLTRLICLVWLATAATAVAAPKPPATGDVYGWELPRLTHVDTIDFPRRLERNRSYGRVVSEIWLYRDGAHQEINHTYIENGDLTRWAEKVLRSMEFTPGRLDGSPRQVRVPVHIVFLKKDGDLPARYEVWLPTDTANYQRALINHFLAVNESLPPLLIRVGSYDRPLTETTEGGLVSFEVYLRKDGGREEGKLIASLGDAFTRQALTSAVELQILPPHYRRQSYGCWCRVHVGFCEDWAFPTQPLDLRHMPYSGWPVPMIGPVAVPPTLPPRFVSVGADSSQYDANLLMRASELVLGHAIYYALVNTAGEVAEWFRARTSDPDALSTDWEYLSYGTRLLEQERADLGDISLAELARLAGDELETIIPTLKFEPGRGPDGVATSMWVIVTPGILR